MTRPFAPGDQVLLLDTKHRRHLVTLAPDGEFHSHAGVLRHNDLLGREEGVTVLTTLGARLVAVRPTLGEYVLEMPRGAQVIYPKDLGPILLLADIYPGARVLESGVGSGALTMTLLRAVGPDGFVTGYELREDFATRARRNVEALLGTDLPLRVEVRDAYEGIDETDLDRIVLDLPEPWRVVAHAERGAPRRRHRPRVPPHHRAGGPPARGARRLGVRDGPVPRGHAARLARRRAVGAPRPPDGGPHRVPHHGPAAQHVRVNLLDLFLVAVLLLAAYSGYRFGFAARALSWVGLALGLVVGAEFVDSVARTLHGSTPQTRLIASLAFLLVVAVAGQAVGFAIGSVLHRHLPRVGGFRTADRLAGAVAGIVGVLVVVWLLIPGLANAPGWPARAVRGSAIVREIDTVAPSPAVDARHARPPRRRRAVPRGVPQPHRLGRRRAAGPGDPRRRSSPRSGTRW